jgi:adenylate cyclase
MLRFHLNNKREQQQFEHDRGPIELGRGPKRNNVARCVVQDLYVSKDHVRVEERPPGHVRIENLSQRNPVWFADSTSLGPGSTRDCPLPVRLTVGETMVDIEPLAADGSLSGGSLLVDPLLQTITSPLRARAGRGDAGSSAESNRSVLLSSSPDPETLIEWFETVIEVQKSAAGSPEFYEQTAQAMIDLVGLDRGMVLLRKGDSWQVMAAAGMDGPEAHEFSHTILRHVLENKKTFYQSGPTTTESMAGIKAVVASPIFDAQGEGVVGVVYGTKSRLDILKGFGVGRLQAYVVQLLASAVGVGLARLSQEEEASRQRVLFGQFFSEDLARELARNPRLLDGQEREITVLFCDIRGFSQTAERITPRDTCKLIGDVMDRMTERIKEYNGVVVDYMGDGLLAMWNAPAEQPDHAALACRAALAMQADMPALSAEWEPVVGGTLGLGVGLNTGNALVGNTGSKFKFKYGPLGHTVNLASRVEGATKHLHIPTLITGSTRALIGDQFATRKLCRARVVGVRNPVELYELHAEQAAPEWLTRRDAFEKALEQFEKGEFTATLDVLHGLRTVPGPGQRGKYDIPSLELATRALECMKNPPEEFDPVMELKNK